MTDDVRDPSGAAAAFGATGVTGATGATGATGSPGAPGGPPPGPGGAAPTLQQLWRVMRSTGIRRPTDDRWLGGVCAGTARRLGVDPLLLRVALVGLTVLGGVGVVAYAVALVLLPDHDGRIELERAADGDLTGTTVGAVALLLLGIVAPGPWELLRGGPLVDGGDLVGALVVGTLLLIGLSLLPRLAGDAQPVAPPDPSSAVPGSGTADGDAPQDSAFATRDYGYGYGYGSAAYGGSGGGSAYGYGGTAGDGSGYDRSGYDGSGYGTPGPTDAIPGEGTPPPPVGQAPAVRPYRPRPPERPGPGPAVSAAVIGLALLVAGGLWFATDVGLVPGRPAVVALAGAATLLGGAIVALGLAGRRDGAVGGAAFLVVVVAVSALLVPSWRTTQLAGEAVWRPATVTAAERGGSIGLGSGVLDLRSLPALADGQVVRIPVRTAIGNVEVRVPEGLDVRVEAGAMVGAVRDPGERFVVDGVGVERTVRPGDDPVVVVDARVLVGEVVVVEVAAP